MSKNEMISEYKKAREIGPFFYKKRLVEIAEINTAQFLVRRFYFSRLMPRFRMEVVTVLESVVLVEPTYDGRTFVLTGKEMRRVGKVAVLRALNFADMALYLIEKFKNKKYGF